jgi:hypothetical protein
MLPEQVDLPPGTEIASGVLPVIFGRDDHVRNDPALHRTRRAHGLH